MEDKPYKENPALWQGFLYIFRNSQKTFLFVDYVFQVKYRRMKLI